jgi:hypothetical protein
MAAGGGAAAAAAAIADAIRASGVLIRVQPAEFAKILARGKDPLVIAEAGFFTRKFQYLTSYKGLAFFTSSKEAVQLPADVELITAKKIYIPG